MDVCPVLKFVVGLSFGHGVHVGLIPPSLYVLIGHLIHVFGLHIHFHTITTFYVDFV